MKKLKEHKFPTNSFIGGWYIPKKITKSLIGLHGSDKRYQKSGVTYNVDGDVNHHHKKSIDVCVKPFTNHKITQPYEDYVIQCVKNYSKKYFFCNELESYGLYEEYNIQHYEKGGGFYSWHCERNGNAFSFRHLVFMTYLNDVSNGGTDFYYQKIKAPAKNGLTLIWPADWTHTHRGIITKKEEKYIATGWITYTSSKIKQPRCGSCGK